MYKKIFLYDIDVISNVKLLKTRKILSYAT